MQRARHSFLGDQWINQNKQIAVWCEQGWWKQAICGYPACQDLFFSFQWPHISLFQVLAVCALSIPSAQLKRCSHLIVVAIKSNCFCYQQRKELKTRLHEWWWSKGNSHSVNNLPSCLGDRLDCRARPLLTSWLTSGKQKPSSNAMGHWLWISTCWL